MRSKTERPRTLPAAQNLPPQRTITTLRALDRADRDSLDAEYGADLVRKAYRRQQLDILANAPLRTLREILRGDAPITSPSSEKLHAPVAASAPETPTPAPTQADALSSLYTALREANDAGLAIDATPRAVTAPRGQPDLFLTTYPHPHDAESKACPCSCCVHRRDTTIRWKQRQPPRLKHRYVYGSPRWWGLADREAEIRVKTCARAKRKRNRSGDDGARLQQSDLDVLYMLISYQNAHTGRCDPSMATLAAKTGRHVSTVNAAIGRLEAAGLIVVIRRRRKVRDGKGAVWRTEVIQNGYHIVDPLRRYRQGRPEAIPSDSEIPNGVRAIEIKEGRFTARTPLIPGIAGPGGSGVTLDG